MQPSSEKRLIYIFKTFVDKAFIPQIKRFEGSLLEWSRFASLLFVDSPNLNELQSYVESMPLWGTGAVDKFNTIPKKLDVEGSEMGAFNPNKTFGGERSKPNMFPFTELDSLDSRRQSQRDESIRQKVGQNNSLILSNLEKLLKSVEQNQNVIESLVQSPEESGRPAPSNTYPHSNGSQVGSQSYNQFPQVHQSFHPPPGPQSQSQPLLQAGHMGYYKAPY